MIRRTICLHRPGSPTTQPVIATQVHLAPLAQTSYDPLSVTYTFNATATAQAGGTTKAVALPKGVIELFDGGTLACAVNVGGTVTGGSCPITYASFGSHNVVVTYLGPDSSTETVTEQINPFTTSTSIALSGPYECVDDHETEPETESCKWTASVSTIDQYGGLPRDGENSLAIEVAPEEEFTVSVDPGLLLQEGPAFDGPVTFLLLREHGKEGWRCSMRTGPQISWFEVNGWWSEQVECGISMAAYGSFNGGLVGAWTSSRSASVPVYF